jgi:Flp pilus assembly protein TadG
MRLFRERCGTCFTQTTSLDRAKMNQVRSPRRSDRRGAAAVEFALVAPIFFLLVLGMVEFGRMVMVQQVLTNAAREGARVAVFDGATSDDVKAQVRNYLTAAHLPATDPVLDPVDPKTAGYGDPMKVTVQIPFSQVSWLPSPFLISGSTQLTASVVMRRETVQ